MIPLAWRLAVAAGYVAGWTAGTMCNAPFKAWRRWVGDGR